MNVTLFEGFHLTEYRTTDAATLAKQLSTKAIYRNTLRVPYPYTLEHARQWLERVERQTSEVGQPLQWAIRNSRKSVIGGVGLERADRERAHSAEIGYWLAQRYWGRGIATAAVGAICRHALENLGLTKITAHVFSFNVASSRVLEKCGFVQEGYLRQHYVKDGQFLDALAFGLLGDSWKV